MIVQRGTLPWIDIKRDMPGRDAANGPLWSNERKEKKKDSQRWNDDDVEWDGLWEKKKRTKGKIRLLAVARNNGTRPGNWQWGEKVMEAVLVSLTRFLWSIWSSWLWSPLSLGSVLDSRVVCRVGTRIYYSAACFTSAAETIGKRERKRAGPQTFEGHSHLSISSLLSFPALSFSLSLSIYLSLSLELSTLVGNVAGPGKRYCTSWTIDQNHRRVYESRISLGFSVYGTSRRGEMVRV